jgi:hypothetical protein
MFSLDRSFTETEEQSAQVQDEEEESVGTKLTFTISSY